MSTESRLLPCSSRPRGRVHNSLAVCQESLGKSQRRGETQNTYYYRTLYCPSGLQARSGVLVIPVSKSIARSFSQNSVLLYTSTRLEYETRKVFVLSEYSSSIAQGRPCIHRTPPSPQLPSTLLTSRGDGMVTSSRHLGSACPGHALWHR